MAPKQKPGQSKQDYQTPPEFLIAAKRKLGIRDFVVDLAATMDNSVAVQFYDQVSNGLTAPWETGPNDWNWLNPEYSDIEPWVKRAYEVAYGHPSGNTAVLIPASIGANWWRDWVVGKCHIVPLNGRLTFVGETDPYPKDCALLLYGPDVFPGYEAPWTWMNDLTEDEKKMAKTRTAKPKADNVTNISDGPKTRKGKKFAHSLANAAEHLAQTVQAPPVDPPTTVQEPDASRLLKELGDLNDRALEAKHRYEGLKEDTKAARETYDSLAAEVLRKIQVATHPAPMPLFDAEQRERDQAQMLKAADPAQDAAVEEFVNGATGAPQGVSESDHPQDTSEGPIASGASNVPSPEAVDSIF